MAERIKIERTYNGEWKVFVDNEELFYEAFMYCDEFQVILDALGIDYELEDNDVPDDNYDTSDEEDEDI